MRRGEESALPITTDKMLESQDFKGNVNFKNNNKDVTLQTSKK